MCGTMANAQTASFTYQGKLTDNTLAANGTYQIQFGLFDAQSGGNQIGATQTNAVVTVTDGIFTVNLGFGAAAFDGADRFLQISVFSTTTNAFVALNPRQQITSAPYAVRSLNAGLADMATNAANLGNVPAGNFVQTNDSRLSDNRNPTAGSGSYIQNGTVQQATSNFNISGNGTVGGTLSANSVSAVGTVSANVVSTATQYRIGGNRVLSVAGNSNIFAGVNAGGLNTTGSSNSFFGESAGQSNTIGVSNSIFGSSAGRDTLGDDNSFFGAGAGNFTTTGDDNSFFGQSAGRNTSTGGNNTFVGSSSGITNTTGGRNTLIGAFANVGNNNLSHATAIGADAVVSVSNTVVLGRSNGSDTVRIAGLLRVTTLGAAGNTNLCRNPDDYISSCSSSLRYKTNIAPFNPGLSLVNLLRPITFDWKEGGMHDLGLGAEDVAAIEPLLVTYNPKGEVEGVKYDRLSVVFVNAFKEQQAQIEKQQKQIATLLNANAALNTRVRAVEKRLPKKRGSARR